MPPTLVVSGYLDAEVARALEALPEVVGTLAKPYDFATLEARMGECLARSGGRPGAAPGIEAAAAAAAEDEEGWIEIVPASSAEVRREPREQDSGVMPFRLR